MTRWIEFSLDLIIVAILAAAPFIAVRCAGPTREQITVMVETITTAPFGGQSVTERRTITLPADQLDAAREMLASSPSLPALVQSPVVQQMALAGPASEEIRAAITRAVVAASEVSP